MSYWQLRYIRTALIDSATFEQDSLNHGKTRKAISVLIVGVIAPIYIRLKPVRSDRPPCPWSPIASFSHLQWAVGGFPCPRRREMQVRWSKTASETQR